MAAKNRRPMVEGLVTEILSATGRPEGRGEPRALVNGVNEVRSLAERDYAAPLRSRLAASEVQEILAEARKKAWPRLNCEPLRLGALEEFAERASSLGIHLRVARWSSPEGLALLGFYVKRTKRLFERPLICVNAAHHPAVMATAFSHEIGHHVTSQIFASRKEPANFLLYTGYGDHLDDRVELAADVLASLGIYPKETARRIFCNSRDSRRGQGVGQGPEDAMLAEALDDVRVRYAFDLRAVPSVHKRLQYLAGLIHYTKLRRALLDEYDI